MKKIFDISLTGYDTCEWYHKDDSMEYECETLEQAEEYAKKWCDENSYMGGYEWHVNWVRERE